MTIKVWANVVSVTVAAPLTLYVTFEDGVTGTVRFELSHLTGVFAVLKDVTVLNRSILI